MKYVFVVQHRPLFSVCAMCRCLRIHPSGFYAWLKNPLSKRAREDYRQTKLIKNAWEESGKVYGYRKLHDDLLDQGEACCLNRVARLANIAGIRAQIGYKRRPGTYGGMMHHRSARREALIDPEEAADDLWSGMLGTLKARTR